MPDDKEPREQRQREALFSRSENSEPLSYEDYPFDEVTDAGAWTVMRHQANKKSFALIYERNTKLSVNLKCNPFEADFFRQMYQDLTPAYHMNKTALEHGNAWRRCAEGRIVESD